MFRMLYADESSQPAVLSGECSVMIHILHTERRDGSVKKQFCQMHRGTYRSRLDSDISALDVVRVAVTTL